MIKDKNVLITGADGFIGSHLTEKLVKEGAHVKALSQYNSFNNCFIGFPNLSNSPVGI